LDLFFYKINSVPPEFCFAEILHFDEVPSLDYRVSSLSQTLTFTIVTLVIGNSVPGQISTDKDS